MKLEEAFFQEERLKQIQKLILENGRVTVKDLSENFSISLVTIRKDLKQLEQEGKIIRTHGGAISRAEMDSHVAFEKRKNKNREFKENIGRAAAELVEPGDVIFIDASTTTVEMCPHIIDLEDLTVITNSIEIAYRLSGSPVINLIVLGGSVKKETMSVIDNKIKHTFSDWMINKAFFGGWGFSVKDGLTDLPGVLIMQKKTVAEHAKVKIGLMDVTKIGKGAMDTFVKTEELDILVTNNSVSDEFNEEMKKTGVRLILC